METISDKDRAIITEMVILWYKFGAELNACQPKNTEPQTSQNIHLATKGDESDKRR
jgi:hypothetical protein